MAELLEMDLSRLEDEEELEEITQRFQAFIAAEVELTPSMARQVMLVDLAKEDRVALLAPSWRTEVDEMGKEKPMEWRAVLLAAIKDRREQGLSTRMQDLMEDRGASQALRASVREHHTKRMNSQARRQAELLQKEERHSVGAPIKKPPAEEEGSYECVLKSTVLTKVVNVIVDTGVSHNIVSYRTVQRLKLGEAIKATRKAFLTAGGELSFPVGEIEALPVKVGGK